MTVSGGAALTAGATRIGDVANGNGAVRVEGAITPWTSTQALVVGRFAQGGFTVAAGGTANVGTLTVDSGGIVESGALTQAGASGRVVILNGGTLRSASLGLGNPARLDWRSGVLHITGPTGVALVAGRLQLDRGVLVSTDGGAHALQMDGLGTLVAQGQVGARIVGGSLRNTVIASGPLTLGLLTHSDGFAFSGQLDLGKQQVVLLDRDVAGLGTETLLRDGAQLVSVNGARLDAGARLRSAVGGQRAAGSGSGSVQGRFINNGLVESGASPLTFMGSVSGSGGFAGNVRFLAGYEPGGDPGSRTAQVGFGGGNIAFGPYAVLTLQIDTLAPGTGFDQLAGIDDLNFDGTRVLDLGSGFAAAPGTVLSLIDFRTFSGRLDAARTVVNGFDATQLNLSRLAIDGTLSITAVPEPAAPALGLAGLHMLGLAVRRLRKWPR